MIAAADPNAGARRAALALHALGEIDRAWMLQQLPPHQRALIEALLCELRGLGVPSDARLPEPTPPEPENAAEPSRAFTGAGRRQMKILARLLEREPPQLTRAFLATLDAAARSRVLQALEPGLAARLTSSPTAMRGGLALQRALAAAVERRLVDDAPSAGWLAKTWSLRRRST